MIRMHSCPMRAYGVLVWKLLFLAFILTGCGNGGDQQSHTQSPENGGLAFQAVWPRPEGQDTVKPSESTEDTEDICTTFGVETITATVVDAQGTQRGTGSWPCDIEGHKGTINAIPAGSGYRVLVQATATSDLAWHGETTGITIEGNKTTIIEKIIMHALEFTLHASSSDGGRIEPSGSIAASAISAQTFTFTPRSGYEIDEVLIDGTSHGYMDSYTFSNISADRTIYVSFVPTTPPAVTHTITATAGAGGTIVPEGQIEVPEGNDQTFTFQPAPGNHVADVFVDGVSQGVAPSHTFSKVAAAHTVRVAFDATTYTISATAGPGGQIDPAGDITTAHGSTPAFTITPDAGFYLAGLQINGKDVLPQNAYTFEPVSDDATISAVFKAVRFVDANAQPGGDGTSWQSAFRTLEDAILAAGNGDDIWIKAGTYLLTNQVSVPKTVAIYGGFTGTELFAHERNWQDNPTVFDGQDQTRAFFISADARLDGLIVQNCYVSAVFGVGEIVRGGALYIDNCAPTIANCTFINNRMSGDTCSGGTIYADNSSPIFQDCHIEGNETSCEFTYGGTMGLKNSTSTISGCRFIDNEIIYSEITNGGCLEIERGAAVISESQFRGNSLRAETVYGGTIYSGSADLTITACQFVQNRSDAYYVNRGGALYIEGSNTAQNPVIQNSIFLDNLAGFADRAYQSQGGALFISNSAPAILNCTFTGNSARAGSESQGGAIANASGNPTITNTILWGNQAIVGTGDTTADGEGMQLYDDATSSSTVSYSVIDGPVPNGSDNINQAPLLDAFGHLQPGSIGLDAGSDTVAPGTDIDGEDRPQNGRSDIGADELVDGDLDQIPDYWERHYGLDTSLNDSGEDMDGDGLSNLIEYQLKLNPAVANPVLDAQNRGSYNGDGFHDEADNGTPCGSYGYEGFRSYFTYDIPVVSGTVVGAALRLELVIYDSNHPSETFEVRDVTTDPATLEASGNDQKAIYTDLGRGGIYAKEVSISPGDVQTIIGFNLSATAVSDINASQGGSFSVGVSSTSYTADGVDLFKFSEESESRTHQLVLIVE